MQHLECTAVHGGGSAHHVHGVSHGEDEDGGHGPGVASPARVVNPGGERHQLLGKDLRQQSDAAVCSPLCTSSCTHALHVHTRPLSRSRSTRQTFDCSDFFKVAVKLSICPAVKGHQGR